MLQKRRKVCKNRNGPLEKRRKVCDFSEIMILRKYVKSVSFGQQDAPKAEPGKGQKRSEATQCRHEGAQGGPRIAPEQFSGDFWAPKIKCLE